MSIVQDTFILPPEIENGLLTGNLVRKGSVVRNATGSKKGQIYKHLDPIETRKDEERDEIDYLAQTAMSEEKENNIGILSIIVPAVITAVVTGVVICLVNREPKAVKNFNSKINDYFASVKNGTLSIEQIDSLMDSLRKIKMLHERKKIHFTFEQINLVLDVFKDYTIRLAKDNDFLIKEDELNTNNSDNVIICFEKYLQVQKNIFESAS